MRWLLIPYLLGLVSLFGCNGQRFVTPAESARRFERVTADNDRLPLGGNVERRAVVQEVPVTIVDVEPSAVRVAAGLRPHDPFTAEYRPGNVITIRGPVVGFRRIPLTNDRTGLFVRVKVGGEFPEVYLGPEHWLIDNSFPIPEITHVIAAKGSPLRTTDGRSLLIAKDATYSGLNIAIRNDDGSPLYPVPID
jgi:hypothetical protein